MPHPEKNPEIDEAVWQAWLKKNQTLDRFRYERRLRIMALVAVLATSSALLSSALLWWFVD